MKINPKVYIYTQVCLLTIFILVGTGFAVLLGGKPAGGFNGWWIINFSLILIGIGCTSTSLLVLREKRRTEQESAGIQGESLQPKSYTGVERKIFEGMSDGVMSLDKNGTVIYVNPACEILTALNSEEMIGKHWTEIFPEDQPAVHPASDNGRMNRQTGSYELTFKRKTGEQIHLLISENPYDPAPSSPTESDSSNQVPAASNGSESPRLLIIRDISARYQREQELEAVVEIAAALRTPGTCDEMVQAIVDQAHTHLKAEACAVLRKQRGDKELVVAAASGIWSRYVGEVLSTADTLSLQVYKSGQLYLNNNSGGDKDLQPFASFLGEIRAVACIPLITQKVCIGVLWVGTEMPIEEKELRLLTAVSDIAANALHRAELNEETQQRVQRLAALRNIDITITASLDLRLTLDILLGQVTSHLNVDAACVLLYNPNLQVLEYVTGNGFRTTTITRCRFRLGEGHAGQAALERRTIHIPNLQESGDTSLRRAFITSEGFISYYAIPLIAKGGIKGVLEIFHRTELITDHEWLDFLEALAIQAAIAIENARLFDDLQRSNMELILAYDATLEGWIHALDLRDKETEGHTQRVTTVTLQLARNLGVSESDMINIRRGALLHDIGKVAIPDRILRKTGPLTPEERAEMERHPVYAYELLAPISYLQPALDIPYCHHEKWDGTGYPRRLKGEQIPLMARIFAVVDVWDALRSNRPYRAAWPEPKVIEYLKSESGKHFDPRILDCFLNMLESLPHEQPPKREPAANEEPLSPDGTVRQRQTGQGMLYSNWL